MTTKAEITDIEHFVPAPEPSIITFRTQDGPWVANATDWVDAGLRYVATRLTEAEMLMLRQNRFSLRGAALAHPWHEMISNSEGLRFTGKGGQIPEEKDLCEPFTGIDISLPHVPDSMPGLEVVETLFEFDGPMILLLTDGRDLWLAICESMSGPEPLYVAGRVSAKEAEAIRNETLSVRAALTDRPWFGVVWKEEGYRFGDGYGQSYPENEAPMPGIGLISKEGLPDRLDPNAGAPSPI
ncbi:hypothetical protein ACEUZ9_000766 [Paracoccus litorisediminis]|uniref:hypothetical protein n=1 Tax=Paracoccus litorisediminis TaxID=2006130 RepID=UPI00373063A7